MKRISYSQYSQWDVCPYKWKLNYIDKLGTFTDNIHTLFGTSMHEVLQTYLTIMYNDTVKVADALPLDKMLLKKDELGNDIPDRDFFGIRSVMPLTLEHLILQVRSGLGFEKDFPYFFRTVILREKYEVEPFLHDWYIFANVNNPKDDYGFEASFWDYLHNLFWETVIPDIENPKAVNNEMSGSDYEEYCANILSNAGWKVSITKASNDQGVDIVAEIENLKYCIQCKRYSNPVSNKAVQEVYAGKDFYQGTHAVVVSNAGFTKSARDLAKSSGVILISDIELEKLESFQ